MESHSDALTHVADGKIVICARKEEKILRSPVIKQALEAKMAKLEANRHVTKENRKRFAERRSAARSTARALSHFSQTMMWSTRLTV
ncbi:recombination-associated protein RdgC [Shigella flexneri]